MHWTDRFNARTFVLVMLAALALLAWLFYALPLSAQEKPKPPDKPAAAETTKPVEVTPMLPESARLKLSEAMARYKMELQASEAARARSETILRAEVLPLLKDYEQQFGKPGWTLEGNSGSFMKVEPPKKDEAKPATPPKGPGSQ